MYPFLPVTVCYTWFEELLENIGTIGSIGEHSDMLDITATSGVSKPSIRRVFFLSRGKGDFLLLFLD